MGPFAVAKNYILMRLKFPVPSHTEPIKIPVQHPDPSQPVQTKLHVPFLFKPNLLSHPALQIFFMLRWSSPVIIFAGLPVRREVVGNVSLLCIGEPCCEGGDGCLDRQSTANEYQS